jgi:phosphoesterase RecJ-like protein
MSFWPSGIGLKEALSLLPEPILIVGNKATDGDSAGCIVALLDHLREEAIEAYTYFATPPDFGLNWMFDPEDINSSILEDYASLIVVDDYVDADRLGIPIKENVPIINIDHHLSRKPEKADLESLFVGVTDWTMTFWALVPATAAILIASEITHPYLWISLYTDSVGFTVNGVSTAKWAYRLIEGLENKGEPLSNELQEQMQQKITRVGSLSSFHSAMNAKTYTFDGTFNGEPFQVAIGVIDTNDKETAMKYLQTLYAYSHVAVVTSKNMGWTSLRSRTYDFDVSAIAKSFGGGGHLRASGCTLPTGDEFEASHDRLRDLVINKLENVRMRMYI